MVKSKVLTASGAVETVSSTVHVINITSAASGTSPSVIVYDNPSAASGNIIFQGDGKTEMSYVMGDFAGGGTTCVSGIYVATTAGTTAATVVITYE